MSKKNIKMEKVLSFENFVNERSEALLEYKMPANYFDVPLPDIVQYGAMKKMKWRNVQINMKQLDGGTEPYETITGTLIPVSSIPKGLSKIYASLLNTDGNDPSSANFYEIDVNRIGSNLTFHAGTPQEITMSISDFKREINNYQKNPLKTRKGRIPGGSTYDKKWHLYFFV
jgi:hypothetical protein